MTNLKIWYDLAFGGLIGPSANLYAKSGRGTETTSNGDF